MTDIKELIEKIKENPLAITDEIDWVEETNDFNAYRMRRIIYHIPYELYAQMKEIIISSYYKRMIQGPGCAARTFEQDDRFYDLECFYGSGCCADIENFFYWAYEERLTMEREALKHEERKDSVRKKLQGISETEDDSDIKNKLRLLEIENHRLENENNKQKETIQELKTQNEMLFSFNINDNDDADGLKLGLTVPQWAEIRNAIIKYINTTENADIVKWRSTFRNNKVTQTEIAKYLSKLTGFSIYRLSKEVGGRQEREAAKQLLQDLANLIS